MPAILLPKNSEVKRIPEQAKWAEAVSVSVVPDLSALALGESVSKYTGHQSRLFKIIQFWHSQNMLRTALRYQA